MFTFSSLAYGRELGGGKSGLGLMRAFSERNDENRMKDVKQGR
jgi:hypothetical protein